jgi:hypothetical protein
MSEIDKDDSAIRTQKAKSILAIDEHLQSHAYCPPIKLLRYKLIQSREEINLKSLPLWVHSFMEREDKKVFARCCPTVPRHGFEDSIVVNNMREMKNLWDKMIVLDPKSEMILMPYINAHSSSIITPRTISVGPGHDGATNARSPVFFNYDSTHSNDNLNESWSNLPQLSGVQGHPDYKDKHPYVEMVVQRFGNDQQGGRNRSLFDPKTGDITRYMVQCREGPALEGASKDYLPEDMTAEHVYRPDGTETLVEWETIVATFKPNTVVEHKTGCLSSHWGVHCEVKKVPYITSCTIYKGSVLTTDQFRPRKFAPKFNSFLNGVITATAPYGYDMDWGIYHEDTPRYRELLYLFLFALHNYRAQEPELGNRLLGLGVGSMMRLLNAACLGEMRHSRRRHPNRQQIFAGAWADYLGAQTKMVRAYRSFRDHNWAGGFGGEAWKKCAEMQITLHQLCVEMTRRPTKIVFNDIESAFNEAVNLTHNNGWVFNKFAEKEVFDAAAESSIGFAAACTSVLELHREFLLNGMSAHRRTNGYHYIMKVHKDTWSKQRAGKSLTLVRDYVRAKSVLIDIPHLKKTGLSIHDAIKALRPKPAHLILQGCIYNNPMEDSTKRDSSPVLHLQYKSSQGGHHLTANIPLHSVADGGKEICEKIHFARTESSLAGTENTYAQLKIVKEHPLKGVWIAALEIGEKSIDQFGVLYKSSGSTYKATGNTSLVIYLGEEHGISQLLKLNEEIEKQKGNFEDEPEQGEEKKETKDESIAF